MTYQIKTLIFIIFLSLNSLAKAIEVIDILGGKAGEIAIAVLPFEGDGGEKDIKFNEIVKADLERSGFFRAIKTDGIKNIPKNINDIDFGYWTALKAELAIVGKVEKNDAQVKVTWDLVDIFKQKLVTTMEYVGNPNQERLISHRISNLVYEKVTGTPGVFHTKIGYVKKFNDKKYTLNISDLDGFNAKAVVTSTQPIISTRWSPDGKKIAYVSFEKKKPVIFVQDLATGERKLVANFKGNNSAPAWSPDSKQLALVLTYNEFSQIYVMNADGSDIKRLMRSRYIDTEPAWAPDGKSIYFTSDRGGGPQIYKINLDDKEIKRVTFEGKYNVSPRLTPDGKFMTFITLEGGKFKVAAQNLNSNQVLKLTKGSNDESPVFAPNGHMVLYTLKNSGDVSKIATVSLNGFKIVPIEVGANLVQEPTWSPIDY